MVQLIHQYLLIVKTEEELQQFINSQDNNGDTLLHIACRSEYEEIVEYLLKIMKMDTDLRNKNIESALQIAQETGNEQVLMSFMF